MGACLRHSAKTVNTFLNVLVILSGLALVGFSIYALVQTHSHNNFTVYDGFGFHWIPWIMLSIGFMVTSFALSSIFSTLEERRCSMTFFAIMQFIFGVATLFFGVIFIIVYQRQAEVSSENSSELSNEISRWLNDDQLGTYVACCSSGSSVSIKQCQANQATPQCYWSTKVFQSAKSTDASTCQSFNKLDLCGSSPADFKHNMLDIMQTIQFPTGIAFAAFGSLLLLAAIGNAYLGCCASHNARSKPAQRGSF